MKIYTKTGDKGTTSIYGGDRVSKSALQIKTIGSMDELNAYIGLIADLESPNKSILQKIQHQLFNIGAMLSISPENSNAIQKNNIAKIEITQKDVLYLEDEIDSIQNTLPPLKNFILPGGHSTASTCHIARAVCRRAECNCVALQQQQPVNPIILAYLNRLSDYLFVFSRKIVYLNHCNEIEWKKYS